jgi:hypothetical protein
MSTSSNLNIPVSLNLIVELIKKLPKRDQKKIVSLIQEQDDFEVPQWQQKIVLDRIKNSKPDDYIEWKDFKKELKRKYDF